MSQTPKRRQQPQRTQKKVPAARGDRAAARPAEPARSAAAGQPTASAETAKTAKTAKTAQPPEPAEQAAPFGPLPLRLAAAAGVAALEGLAVAAWGVTTLFTGGDTGVLAGLLVLVLAAIPLAAAHGLRRASRWSRGPALIMQLLSLPVAWTMLHSDGTAIAVAGGVLGALAGAGLVLLVHPATTDALGISRTRAS